MKFIPLGKTDKYAIVDDEDYPELSKYKWCIKGKKYAGRCVDGKVVLMHRQLFTPRPGFLTDHINRNKLDNRRSNLRECTKSQNYINIEPKSNTHYIRQIGNGYWKASTHYHGEYIEIGIFKEKIDAIKAWNDKRKELFGEFAVPLPENAIGCPRKQRKTRTHYTHKNKYRGLSYHNTGGKERVWQSQISYNGKRLYIGTYSTQEQAAIAYNEKAKELFGDRAELNVIECEHGNRIAS